MPFLDHMLDQIARHGLIDLEVEARATSISTPITPSRTSASPSARLWPRPGATKGADPLRARLRALDEALSRVVIDLSAAPASSSRSIHPRAWIGQFDVDLVNEFFQGLVNHAGMTFISITCAAATPTTRPRPSSGLWPGAAPGGDADPRMAGPMPSTKGSL